MASWREALAGQAVREHPHSYQNRQLPKGCTQLLALRLPLASLSRQRRALHARAPLVLPASAMLVFPFATPGMCRAWVMVGGSKGRGKGEAEWDEARFLNFSKPTLGSVVVVVEFVCI
jgi:hypothetical protein